MAVRILQSIPLTNMPNPAPIAWCSRRPTPGAWNVRTNTVVVDAPPLSVSLNFVDRDDARPFLGETVKVRAVVRAGRDELGPLSGLAFSGTPALEVPAVFAIELRAGKHRDWHAATGREP